MIGLFPAVEAPLSGREKAQFGELLSPHQSIIENRNYSQSYKFIQIKSKHINLCKLLIL
jgi:hypothetical protein